MKVKELLEKVTAGFIRTREEVNVDRMIDFVVPEIALLIAALDGSVLPDEFASYKWIVGRCSAIANEKEGNQLDAVMGKAGRLLLMEQTGAYSENERLAVFDEMVNGMLPEGFAGCSPVNIRRAFVLWLSMAISDGEYSDIEHQAIEHLYERLVSDINLGAGFLKTAERLVHDLSNIDNHLNVVVAIDNLIVFGPNCKEAML